MKPFLIAFVFGYCFGRATVHNFLGLTIKTFYGDCKADVVAKAEKFIDNLYNY